MSDDIQQKVKNFFKPYITRTFAKGDLLMRPYETPNVFYLVEGRVSQYDITSSGNEVVVNVFKPGAFFPMAAAINGTPNSYFFEASTRVLVQVAPPADVVTFLKDNPDVLLNLLSRVYHGIEGVLRRQVHLMGGNAKTRLLFELLNAAYRFGQSQDDRSIQIALTENDLARQSGMARETVSRTIQALKEKGLVEVLNKKITIRSTAELEALLGSDM
jgi:CRP-like cAMP-binding protein